MTKDFQTFFRMRVGMWLLLLLPALTGLYGQHDSLPPYPPDEGTGEGGGCCAYSIHLINKYDIKHVWKVRVSALCDTKICCADPDAWDQTGDVSTYVDWTPPGGGPIPFGMAIDNDFMIYLDGASAPHTLQVEWFDAANNVICRHYITIYCDRDYKEDEDWMQYTSTTPLDDPGLSVFAVREPDEDQTGCDSADLEKEVACSISYIVSCTGTNSYTVDLTGTSGFNNYDWSCSAGTIPSGNPTTLTVTAPGDYDVYLNATQDTNYCNAHVTVEIHAVNADFTWERVPLVCSTTIKFSVAPSVDLSDVASVAWSCAGISGFPSSGNSVSYNFTTAGFYDVTMTITDIYGCKHDITKHVDATAVCHAEAKVKEYVFCQGDCNGKDRIDITVTFANLSTGGKCPETFTWDFGDGTPAVVTNESQLTVQHTYHQVPCPNGQSYHCSMTMKDSAIPACNPVSNFTADIMPCAVVITSTVCPDGTVIFFSNVPCEWSTPGATKIFGTPGSDAADANGYHQRIKVQYGTGSHTITATGHCSTGAKCTVSYTVNVTVICMAKNDSELEYVYFTAASGKDYKMKCHFVQRQFTFWHRVKAKTKLKMKKKKWGITYYRGSKADQIDASVNGTIYKTDPASWCKWDSPFIITASDTRYNSAKAKAVEHVGEKYRSRLSSIHSFHQVIVGGTTATKTLDLGDECD